MLKPTLILTIVITFATAGSSFAQKGRGNFSFGGSSSKSSISKSFSGGSSSLRSGISGNSRSNAFNSSSNKSNHSNGNSLNGNIRRITDSGNKHGNHHNTQVKKIDVKKPTFINPIQQQIDPHFNRHDRRFDIKEKLIKHHGNIKPICPPKGDCHEKPHHKPQVNIWWGCHQPVHCHTVIKVPCHQPVREVIVEEPLAQVMVNTTIQLDTAGLSPEAGQLIVQIDQLSMPAAIVEWTPLQAKATIPMMALTGPMKATLHLVNADGSLAQSVNVELIPFNEQVVAAAQ